MIRSLLQSGFAVAVATTLMAPADAHAVDFAAAAGDLAAKVSFDVAPGNLLVVTLSNTSAVASGIPASVLTAVYFKGLENLTTGNAFLPSGSAYGSNALLNSNTVINVTQNYAQYQTLASLPRFAAPDPLVSGESNLINVGGEWGYRTAAMPNGATAGISSSGLSGSFSSPNFLGGVDLASPPALDGLQYGIASAATTDGSGNGGVESNALIRNTVRFVFSNYTGGTTGLANISNVTFQYGTAPSEPQLIAFQCTTVTCSNVVVETPEPMSLAMFGAGLAGLGLVRRRRSAS